MLIDRNDLTNSELEEMGLPLDDFDEPDDDFDIWFDNLYYRDIA